MLDDDWVVVVRLLLLNGAGGWPAGDEARVYDFHFNWMDGTQGHPHRPSHPIPYHPIIPSSHHVDHPPTRSTTPTTVQHHTAPSSRHWVLPPRVRWAAHCKCRRCSSQRWSGECRYTQSTKQIPAPTDALHNSSHRPSQYTHIFHHHIHLPYPPSSSAPYPVSHPPKQHSH